MKTVVCPGCGSSGPFFWSWVEKVNVTEEIAMFEVDETSGELFINSEDIVYDPLEILSEIDVRCCECDSIWHIETPGKLVPKKESHAD